MAGFEDRADEEYRHLTLIEHKVQLMLNPRESDHKRFEELSRQMISALMSGKKGDQDFADAHPAVMDLSRQILKREWDRVKDKIELPI